MDDAEEIDAFAEELEDRFGPRPVDLDDLLEQARLLALAKAAGVRAVRAGPKGVSLSLPAARLAQARQALAPWAARLRVVDTRIVVEATVEDAGARRDLVERLLTALTG